jgi:hypothetical protein
MDENLPDNTLIVDEEARIYTDFIKGALSCSFTDDQADFLYYWLEHFSKQ